MEIVDETKYLRLRMTVAELLASLRDVHKEVVRAIVVSDKSLPALVKGVSSGEVANARLLAASVITTTELDDEQPSASAVSKLPGVVCISARTAEAVQGMNRLRTRLKDTIDKLLDIEIREQTNAARRGGTELFKKVKMELRRPRLSYAMSTRTTQIVDPFPIRVGYSYATSKAIRTLSASDCARQLREMLKEEEGNVRIERDLSELKRIPPDEILALVRELPLQTRLNLVWSNHGKIKRDQLKTTLPLLIVADEQTRLLEAQVGSHAPRDTRERVIIVTGLDKEPDEDAPRRKREQHIEPKPFLRTMRVHRYREGFRYTEQEKKRRSRASASTR